MSNRIALWDNLKFILITLVVAGHFADQLTDYSSSLGFIVYVITTIVVTVILSTKIFNFPVNILKKQIFM